MKIKNFFLNPYVLSISAWINIIIWSIVFSEKLLKIMNNSPPLLIILLIILGILTTLTVFSIHNYNDTRKREKTKKNQKEKESKEDEDRKIQVIKTLMPSQKDILKLYNYNSQVHYLSVENGDAPDLEEKVILHKVNKFVPHARFANRIPSIKIPFKIYLEALEIITKHPEILD